MQSAAMLDPGLFCGFGSRGFRREMQWDPTKEELTAAASALTDEQRAALTWDEAWGFVMPNHVGELQVFQGLQDDGKHSPWRAVMAIRQLSVEMEQDDRKVQATPNLTLAIAGA